MCTGGGGGSSEKVEKLQEEQLELQREQTERSMENENRQRAATRVDQLRSRESSGGARSINSLVTASMLASRPARARSLFDRSGV